MAVSGLTIMFRPCNKVVAGKQFRGLLAFREICNELDGTVSYSFRLSAYNNKLFILGLDTVKL